MGYLTSKEIRHKLKNCSASTLWRYQQPNQKMFEQPMPQPIKKCAGSTSLWDEEMFNEWLIKYFNNNQMSNLSS
ncbi:MULTISPECIES: hypothetical protein [Acinetobacter]|uniref:hypothetical protein n=1 Tax=Acinetobacter TaxID=469 RepID=UPI000248717F|nr:MULTISPECIES: hypothetical protein [Acinetobacter]MCU4383280.1 hypothetical protein [Acinetobacter radioresistens]